MNTFWKKECVSVKHSRYGAYALTIAMIAAVASSCSTMKAESDTAVAGTASSAEELPPAPPIEIMTGEKQKRLQDFFSAEGYENVQFVTLAYSQNGEEKLIVLQLYGVEQEDPEVDDDLFLIPPVGKEFGEAVVLYTGSPAKATSCGRRSSGGTRYCNF